MNRKLFLMIVPALVFFIAVPAALFAEEEFLPRFERELYRYGYTEQEAAMIMTAARERNWRGIENDFAQMAAVALQVCDRVRTETQAREQIELVYHLAAMQKEMEALGFTRREIARVALNTSRGVADQLRTRTRTNADNETGNGDLIRDRIRLEIRDCDLQAQEAKIMERIRNRVRAGSLVTERGLGPR